MKKLVVCFLLIIGYNGYTQFDDNFIQSKMNRWDVDTGNIIKEIELLDPKNKKHKVAEFYGKITLICHWATSCGIDQLTAINNLQTRLRTLGMDSLIQLVTVCTGDNPSKWKKAIVNMDKDVSNFYTDYENVKNDWNIQASPVIVLLDASGKVQAKNFGFASEARLIDYMLYAQTRNIAAPVAYRNFYAYSYSPGEIVKQEPAYKDFKAWMDKFFKEIYKW